MRHLKVPDSDMIESIGFDTTREGFDESDLAKWKSEVGTYKGASAFGTLEVVFKATPDTVYRYENVPGTSFVTLASAACAGSIGKQFTETFKKTKFPFTKSQRPPTLKK
jgi:hypothetical protein